MSWSTMRPDPSKTVARGERIARGPLAIRAFSSSLPMALLRARERVMTCFRPGLRRHGVTEQQWRILRALAGHPGLEVTELAARTCLHPPSLSRILPDLEARGLLARRPVASDMRRSVIALAPGGLDLIASHAPQSEKIYRAIEERFGSERLRQLFELLGQLDDCLAPPPVVRLPGARNGSGTAGERRSGGGKRIAPRSAARSADMRRSAAGARRS